MPPPLSTMFRPADRIDLAQLRSRTTRMSIGTVELSLSTNRSINSADRWSTRVLGLSAAIPMVAGLGLIIGGDYARMSRQLQIVDVIPRRPSIRMARIGMALALGEERRLSIDYLSVACSSRHDDPTRLADMIGGGPLAGKGVEIAFATVASATSGAIDWRFSIGAMQRPAISPGLVDQTALPTDRRALASLRVHL